MVTKNSGSIIPLRVYIAGPYSGSNRKEVQQNVNRAIDVGIEIFLRGHFPYVPHLTDLIDQRASEIGKDLSWDDFILWDKAWLQACDALLFLGESNGASLELKEAKRLGKRIFYSIDEIEEVPRQQQQTYEVS